MTDNKSLAGVKVVELSTFVAAACATRFFADQGADVIKVEPISGDNLRFAAATDGIPEDPYENITYDLENANKKSISLNLKNPECYDALIQLISQADMFVTNWRPQALAKMGLDYETLKVKFPKLVYGSVTGYGDTGPDRDLPGFDGTAFFTRSGILGTTYEKGTVPINLVPSMGDRSTGMALAAGLLAALYRAEKTGHGEKVTISLFAMAIFLQATLLQSSQYGKVNYPILKEETINPLMTSYKTKDGRFIQLVLPVYNIFIAKFAKALGHEEWIEDPRFRNISAIQNGGRADFYKAVAGRFAELTADEASKLLTEADLPYAVAKTWPEVLKDEQAWATNCFYEMDYPSGKRAIVTNPLRFKEAGLPEYNKAPQLGEQSKEILSELGWNEEKIEQFIADKNVRCGL